MTFDPASLFTSGEAGAWYDPSDLSTLFQDSAGTAPVTAPGESVGRLSDKSGNGNHLVQSSAESRPTYQVDSAGNAFLAFDGVDDFLTSPLALPLPFDRVSAIRQLTWSASDRIFTSANGFGLLNQYNISPRLHLYDGRLGGLVDGTLAVGKNGVVAERHIANNSALAVNDRQFASADAGSSAPSSLSVGANVTGANAANMRLYGMLMRAATLADEQMTGLREWMASRAGIVFSTRRQARHSYWI